MSKDAAKEKEPERAVPHLVVMEGLGADGQAVQLDGLLEPGRHTQAPQLVIGMPGQFVGT